jgi:maltose O-acetyltransferase
MKKIYLLVYYLIAQHLPMQPMPGWRLFERIRYFFVKKILKQCGNSVRVNSKCYFGDGSKLIVGDRTLLGLNARLGGKIRLGDDVIMGPDVILMAISHAYDRVDIPINTQGSTREREIIIGDDVWIGTRVVIMPGVHVGSHSIIGSGAVVTKSCKPYSIIGGVPAKIIKSRKDDKSK